MKVLAHLWFHIDIQSLAFSTLDTSSSHIAKLKQSFGKLKAKRVKRKKENYRVAQSANFSSRFSRYYYSLLKRHIHSVKCVAFLSRSLSLARDSSNARSLEDYYVIINCRECILLWLCIYFEWKKKKKKKMNIAHTQWNLCIHISDEIDSAHTHTH